MLGSSNFLLRATSRRHQVREYPGPLSIKTVVTGCVGWKTAGREIRVDHSSFLVLNDGEPYAMDIDSPQPVSTCCVFFQRGFVEDVFLSLTRRDLDERGPGAPLDFLSGLHPRDHRIAGRMNALASAGPVDQLWLD